MYKKCNHPKRRLDETFGTNIKYRQISNINSTKYPNFNDYRLVL